MDIEKFKLFAMKNNVIMYVNDVKGFPIPDDDPEKRLSESVEYIVKNDPECKSTKEEYLTSIRGLRIINKIAYD